MVPVIWKENYFLSPQKYDEYCEIVSVQGLEIFAPYYAWEWGKHVNMGLIALLFLWIPFGDHILRNMLYLFLKKKIDIQRSKTVFSLRLSIIV